MRLILRGLMLALIIVMVSACGNENDNENTYNFEELSMTLTDTTGEEVDVFAANGKELYLYFTGTQWGTCLSQLVELNKYLDDFSSMGVTVYGISPASNEDHAQMKEAAGINFPLLTDTSYKFGENLGFVDFDKNAIYRGYVAVNLDSENLEKEVDYLVGDNIKEVLSVLEDL